MSLPDIQNSKPTFEIGLNRVGITELKLPIIISQKSGGSQNSVAKISCYVDLEPDQKGINMSRLPIGLHKFMNHTLSSEVIAEIAENIRIKSEAKECELTYDFDYFLTKFSPVNKEPGLVDYRVTFTGIKSEDNYRFKFKVRVTATSLCPCSKEISDGGAHNQKCYIEIECEPNDFLWIEEIIDIAEQSASCEIFSVLKRPDEKFVTEKMYNDAKFVEDIARQCYALLKNRTDLENFKVSVQSDESIHMHRAVAKIET
jgi:GTP cyclohydrolase I